MKKTILKKNMNKESVFKSISNSSGRIISESRFWKQIALEQQILLHAKNST